MTRWLRNNDTYIICKDLSRSDVAIVIAHQADLKQLVNAKRLGCTILHRIDEFVEEGEVGYQLEKHERIREINRLADVTIYQSAYVQKNMHTYLDCPDKFFVIHNGASKDQFFPTSQAGGMIGHVTWGIGEKKRLDLLYEFILQNPEKSFLLIGNHHRSGYPFHELHNVEQVGPVAHHKLVRYFHKMRLLYFPSEGDPCPNTVIEAICAGVPVCFNRIGGTKELVMDCGVELERVEELLGDPEKFRARALMRKDLDFDRVAQRYLRVATG